MSFLGLFLGYIDMVLLGRFIDVEFIGYYSAAFHLIGAASALLGFSIVLFPIFSRLKGERLKRSLKKSIKTVLPLSIFIAILIMFFSPLIIKIICGG